MYDQKVLYPGTSREAVVMELEKTRSLVRSVARRTTLQLGLNALLWAITAALFLLAVVSGVAKAAGWSLADLLPVGAGVLAAAVLGAVLYALWRRPSTVAAANLIDEKLGLADRVLSVMSLSREQRGQPAAAILVAETEQAVARVHPGEIAPLSLPRPLWVPLVPLCLAAVLWVFTPQWKSDDRAVAGIEDTTETKSIQELKKRVQKSAQPLEAAVKKLQEQVTESPNGETLKELLGKLERLTQELLNPEGRDPKSVQEKLAELSEMEKRLRELEQTAEFKRAAANTLSQIARKAQDTVRQGPLKQFQDALKRGDLKTASEALKELAEKVKKSSLPPEEKQKLTRQLQALRQAMKDLKELKEAQQRLAKSGLKGDALARALEAMKRDLGDAETLQRLAQQLAQAGQSTDDKQLAQSLQQLANNLDQLANDLQAGDLADDLLQQIADFRARLACPQCKGAG